VENLEYKEDLYNDGMILKTVKRIGYSTARPDKLDTIFFDFRLEHKGKEIYSTFGRPESLWDEKTNKIDAHIKFGERFYLDKKTNCTRLSEYRWSKLFEDALQSMKKFELAEVEVLATEQFGNQGVKVEGKDVGLQGLFGWGQDYDKARKWLEKEYGKDYSEVVRECKLVLL
jgi:hypothetical protein